MKIFKSILKPFLLLISILLCYVICAFVFSKITIDRKSQNPVSITTIFLSTNGVHLDVILHKKDLSSELLSGIVEVENYQFIAFGWGDENFYINTPTWSDLTFKNAFSALFLKSSSLIHITRYNHLRKDWLKIAVSEKELQHLDKYLRNHFKLDSDGRKVLLTDKGYSRVDDFYKAKVVTLVLKHVILG